jgi:hypothetical protein
MGLSKYNYSGGIPIFANINKYPLIRRFGYFNWIMMCKISNIEQGMLNVEGL